MPAANAAAAGGFPRPNGRAPRDCWWDTGVGAWRRNSDNELHDRRAHRSADRHSAAARQRDVARRRTALASASRARRNTRRNAARCNETLLAPAFDLEAVKPESVGLLGAATCEHCHAQLFAGEVADGKRGKKRGRYCCMDGQVVLPEVQGLPRLDALWRDETDAKARLLRQHSRKFNNALALAWELVEEPNLADGSGWQPSVVIQGKLYHLVGPLQAGEGSAPKFAQLYVHDPSAADDVATQRYKHMYLPATTSAADRARAVELLKELQAELRERPTATCATSSRRARSSASRR